MPVAGTDRPTWARRDMAFLCSSIFAVVLTRAQPRCLQAPRHRKTALAAQRAGAARGDPPVPRSRLRDAVAPSSRGLHGHPFPGIALCGQSSSHSQASAPWGPGAWLHSLPRHGSFEGYLIAYSRTSLFSSIYKLLKWLIIYSR